MTSSYDLYITLALHSQLEDLVLENQVEWNEYFQSYIRRHIDRCQELNRDGAPLLVPVHPSEDGNMLMMDSQQFPFAFEQQQQQQQRDGQASSMWYSKDISTFVSIGFAGTDGFGSTAGPSGTPSSIPLSMNSIRDIQFQVDYHTTTDVISIPDSCLLLSCLLQYTVEFTLVPLYSLRRSILPIVVDMALEKAVVSFDPSHLSDVLEEWLMIPCSLTTGDCLHDEQEPDDLAGESVGYTGRSAGVIMTGLKSVGKGTFALELMSLLMKIAPWMVEVSYKNDVERDPSPSSLFHSDFYEGGNFLESGGPVRTLFDRLRQKSRPGKIVFTFIDNMDMIALAKNSKRILEQVAFEVNNANFEFFLFATSSSRNIPSFDCVDSAQSTRSVQYFRTVKLFDVSLDRAYEILVDHVRHAPALAYSERIMTAIRQCGELAALGQTSSPENKKRLQLLLHNMHISDLKKTALQVCLHLARHLEYNQRHHHEIDQETQEGLTLEEALEHVLSEGPVLASLSPDVVLASDWVRNCRDACPKSQLMDVADAIYQRARCNGQFVFFVQLLKDKEVYQGKREEQLYLRYEEDCRSYGKYRIPHTAAKSLMHFLHRRFAFRSSFFLSSPAQVVPHDARHSAALPYTAANPFNEYYWHNKNGCVVIDDLDTIIGYHESQKLEHGSHSGSGRALHQSTERSQTVGQSFDVGVGFGGDTSRATTNSVSDTQSIATGKEQGGSLGIHLSIFPGMGAGLENVWMQHSAIGHVFSNALSAAFGYSPHVSASYGRNQGEHASRHESVSQASKKGKSESFGVNHVYQHPEALAKLIRGFKIVQEYGSRDVERLDNVIIVFYKSTECYREVVEEKLGWNLQDGSYDTPALGCPHFRRGLKMWAPCCERWYTCEKCHDEEQIDHRLDKSAVQQVQCQRCFCKQKLPSLDSSAEQPAAMDDHTMGDRRDTRERAPSSSNSFSTSASASSSLNSIRPTTDGVHCVHCGERFARNSCIMCRLWSDSKWRPETKESELTAHCDRCNQCYPSTYLEYHQMVCVAAH